MTRKLVSRLGKKEYHLYNKLRKEGVSPTKAHKCVSLAYGNKRKTKKKHSSFGYPFKF